MSKKTKHNDNLMDFGRVFEGFQEDTRKPPRPISAALGAIVVSVLMGFIFATALIPAAFPVSGATNFAMDYWDTLPTELPDAPPPQRSVILDKNGDPIAEFFSENRIMTSLESVSPHVIDALISTEDRKFYEHEGVDYQGIARAFVNNARGGNLQGASTITQQLVKNTLLVNARTDEERAAATEVSIQRKLEEVRYAKHLEETLSKDEILEKYLNIALFANGVYGVGTAADYYFSKKADDLTIAESALLVGLLKNPSGYDPIDHPDVAESRRNVVLDLMLSNNTITEAEHKEAVETPLELNINKPANGCNASSAPFYCQWILDSIRHDDTYGETPEEREQLLYRGGLTIQTYYDPEIANDLNEVANRALGPTNRVATSIAPVEAGTGRVPAFAQNHGWGSGETEDGEKLTQIAYADRAAFQTGSAFKVFTLLAALEAGISPNTVFNAPTRYTSPNMNTPGRGITNITRNSDGPLNAYEATRRSSNTWYTVLQEKIGVLTVADMAESLGVPVPREGPRAVTARDASFTLGTISVSPLQMAAANAAISADGIYCEPHGIASMTGPTGEEIEVADGNCRRVFSQQTARAATDVLKGTVHSDDPDRSANTIEMDYPTAAKTGTTNSWTEVWMVGYTPQYATAVWVGDPRGAIKYPLGDGFRHYGEWRTSAAYQVSAGLVAAPIWKEAMDAVHKNLPRENFPPRAGISVANVIPDVRGMEVNAAVSLLQSKGYEVSLNSELAEEDELLTPNHVHSQSPGAGPSGPIKEIEITLTLTHGSDEFRLD